MAEYFLALDKSLDDATSSIAVHNAAVHNAGLVYQVQGQQEEGLDLFELAIELIRHTPPPTITGLASWTAWRMQRQR